MSEKSKISRARREAKQEAEGKNVVKWIFIALIVLALLFMIFTTMMQ